MDDEGVTCGNDGACPRGQVCDEATNRCVEEQNDLCRADDDCGAGERCIDDMCREVDGRCRSDRDCGENAECVENWCVSVEEPEPEPEICREDGDCPDGMVCHDEYFRCIDDPDRGCRRDSDCSNEFACIEGMCRPDGPQPCGEGFEPCQFDWMVCDPQLGVCLPPSCANGQRCPEGLMCEEERGVSRRSLSGVRTTVTVRKIRLS